MLELLFDGEDQISGQKSRHVIGGLFYEAAMDWDAILSYSLLMKMRVGVLSHRACLTPLPRLHSLSKALSLFHASETPRPADVVDAWDISALSGTDPSSSSVASLPEPSLADLATIPHSSTPAQL